MRLPEHVADLPADAKLCAACVAVMLGVAGYCVRCREKRTIKDAQEVTMKNGRPAVKGVCPVCGGGMWKMLPRRRRRHDN